MKIRKDFVTNSSSSSFVIAIHRDITRDEIREAVANLKKEIREYLIEDGKYFGYENENIDSALNIGDFDSATEMVIDEITDRLEGYKDNGGLEIEQWRVYPDRFGSDYGDFYNFIMYSSGASIKSEHLKIAEE